MPSWRYFWDLLGSAIAGAIAVAMVCALLQSSHTRGLTSSRWSATVVVDCLIVLLCMWAIWWLGDVW